MESISSGSCHPSTELRLISICEEYFRGKEKVVDRCKTHETPDPVLFVLNLKYQNKQRNKNPTTNLKEPVLYPGHINHKKEFGQSCAQHHTMSSRLD